MSEHVAWIRELEAALATHIAEDHVALDHIHEHIHVHRHHPDDIAGVAEDVAEDVEGPVEGAAHEVEEAEPELAEDVEGGGEGEEEPALPTVHVEVHGDTVGPVTEASEEEAPPADTAGVSVEPPEELGEPIGVEVSLEEPPPPDILEPERRHALSRRVFGWPRGD